MASVIPTKGPNTTHAESGPTEAGGSRYMAFHDLADGTRVQVEVVTPTVVDNDRLLTVVREAAKSAAVTAQQHLPVVACVHCGGTNGRHGFVHERYGNGGGGNKACPRMVSDEPVVLDVASTPVIELANYAHVHDLDGRCFKRRLGPNCGSEKD